ncbi:MAG: hypothetical protein HQL51_14415 [Magnetococcales bacterium]|nr:hypothetical protein [Magnetococcales bacterium]
METLPPPDQARIFVSIASYRDAECPWTLRDLFLKARHPERVFAGVLWQVAPEDPEAFREVPLRPEQVRGLTVDAASSLGVCWARHRIQAELQGDEAYYLQIDSHSRFAPEWDVKFIAMLAACPSAHPVLTTHPPGYQPPDKLDAAAGAPILWANRFNDEGVLMPKGKALPEDRVAAPRPTAFIGAGCLFTRAETTRRVPYDPHLYFHGEEISLAVRLWTHGCDLFTPNEALVYHDYSDRGRRRHWSDHVDWPALNRRAGARLRQLLKIAPESGTPENVDPEAIRELDRFGLGSVRTLAEYEAFADVDFLRRRIGPRAADGLFPPPSGESPEGLAMRRCFSDIYLNNQWKSSLTRSGPGSTRQATVALRVRLREMLRELGVRVLVDAGCGDLAWIDELTPELELYLGFDVVEELAARNRTLYGHRKNHFFNTADITVHTLPRGDAILCRHTLTHLPNEMVLRALKLFKSSEARYLLATTFPAAKNQEIAVGRWRQLHLTAPPFALPPPRMLAPDGDPRHGCFLGVWKLADW